MPNRFKLTQTDSDAWSVGSRSSFGGSENYHFDLSVHCFCKRCFICFCHVLSSSFSLIYCHVDAGDINPVDCAKQCLVEGPSNCNAFTFEDGVCTLGNVQSALQAGHADWCHVEKLWMCFHSQLWQR